MWDRKYAIVSLERFMSKFNYLFWAPLAFLSAVATYFLVTPNYFPYLGVTLILLFMTGLSFFSQPSNSLKTWSYALICSLLALFISLRSNDLLVFLDFVGALFFGSLLVNRYHHLNNLFTAAMNLPGVVQKIYQSPLPALKLSKVKSELIAGIFISFIVLIVILPAFASANPIFSQWLRAIIPQFTEQLSVNITRIIFWAFLLWFLPKIISASSYAVRGLETTNTLRITWWLPKIIVTLVILLFFISQFQLYTLDSAALADLGLSHSERTREVFGQLIWVALITFGLLIVDLKPRRFRWLNYILIAEAIVLILMALQSDLSYISAWGLTQKRLYGLSLVVWLTGIYGLIVAVGFNRYLRNRLTECLVIFTGIVLVLVNFMNFDYLIAHTWVAHTGQGTDYAYLTRLSSDALVSRELYQYTTSTLMNSPAYALNPELHYALIRFTSKLHYLKEKYSKLDPRNFHLSEYRDYLTIANENVIPIENWLNQY